MRSRQAAVVAGAQQRRVAAGWALGAALTVALCAMIPVIFEPRFYFFDDTEAGAYGIWYRLGEALKTSDISVLEPQRWMAGNLLAEGQWGLFNPLVLGMGLTVSVATNAIVITTLFKVLMLATASVGVFALARSYGARNEFAFVAAVAVPFGGFTVYMDSPSWVTGLLTWSLLPGFWVALRRTREGANPFLALLLGYLIITVGYVHGTIALVVVGLAVLLESSVSGDRRGLWRTAGIGGALALVALGVYLPGLLVADVTVRDSSQILNDNFLNGDLSGLVSGAVPLTQAQVHGWWGQVASVPLFYISWVVPAVAFVDHRRFAVQWRTWIGIAVLVVVALTFVLGPSAVGPLRFPMRMHPYVVLAVVTWIVVALSRARVDRPSMRRLSAAVGLVLSAGFLGFSEVPQHWRIVAVGTVLAFGGVVLAWLALGGSPIPRASASRHSRPPWLLPALSAVMAAAIMFPQQHFFSRSPLPDFGLPASVANYAKPLSGVGDGDVLVLGSVTSGPMSASTWTETLLANAWYLNAAMVQNVYTPLSYRSYAETLCMNWRGETCPDALDALFEPVPGAREPLADLLAISHVQFIRSSFDEMTLESPSEGWYIAEKTPETILWSRYEAVESAGGVVSATGDISVGDTQVSKTTVDIEVSSASGGSVVLSRLAWPGYEVDGGKLGEPLEGFLLTVDVPPGEVGRIVSVDFVPSGWRVGRMALIFGIFGGLAWSMAAWIGARRRIIDERSATPKTT